MQACIALIRLATMTPPTIVKTSCAVCREESDPRYIQNAADVKLRSFTTKVCTAGMSLMRVPTLPLRAATSRGWMLRWDAVQAPWWHGMLCTLTAAAALQVHKVDTLVSYKADAEG